MSYCYNPLKFTEFKKYSETKYPWYKERLQLKYLKKQNNSIKFLLTDDWIFLKDCTNDCRGGYPPSLDENDGIKKGKGSLLPNIFSKTEKSSLPKRWTKQDTVYSKTLPLKSQHRCNIEEIEMGLIQHPLALYPHLEASVPQNIFEEIVDIVDPDMNISTYDLGTNRSVSGKSNTSPIPEFNATNRSSIETEKSTDQSSRMMPNYYKWISKKEEKEKLNHAQNEQKLKMMAENEHIRKITKEFCDWVAELGGQVNSIEEPTVTSLFASGYETKPTLSVPIHVIELTSIPPELRGNVSASPNIEDQKTAELENKKKNILIKRNKLTNEDFEHFRYGAWYLSRKFWKKMPDTEMLQDPKLSYNNKEEHNNKVLQLNMELAHLQGPKLFHEFLEKRTKRKPKFINQVSEIQHQMELEKNLSKEEKSGKPN